MSETDRLTDMTTSEQQGTSMNENKYKVDPDASRYPCCVVWTPIPILTWIIPFIGHMGIAMSSGVIRDFAGPYYVSEDSMGFGEPTKYWKLSPDKTDKVHWDQAVVEASEEYKTHMHNLCCDNCHSHVAMALNLMRYNGSNSWNMFKLCFLMLIHGRYVSFIGFLKTWLPFLLIATALVVAVLVSSL